jgi:uncharacterized protein YyaL (SSP411 family)
MARACLNWKAWGPRLFEEAKAGRRPILLLATTFWAEGAQEAPSELASEGAAALLRERVIPAWVDAERSPEVAAQYGLANFPSCALLSPEGALLCRFDPGACDRLRELLDAAAVVVSCGPSDVPDPLGACRIPYLEKGDGSLERGLEIIERIRGRVEAALRPDAGVAGGELAADQAELIRFLLHCGRFTGSKETTERAVAALHRTAHSVLYDGVEGGFFGGAGPAGRRTYKRLDENARWLLLALDVAREPGGGFALPLARGILHYLQSRLAGASGAYFSAQQSDPGYYDLAAEERRRVTPPATDGTVYLQGNALTISACCEGWRLLGEEAYLNMALGAHRFLRETMRYPDGTFARCFRESPEGAGYLGDVVEMGWAEMALFRATLDPLHLRAAGDCARALVERFESPAPPGFLDLRPSPRPTGLPWYPRMSYDANARAAGFLIFASAQLEEEDLAGPARSALGALVEADAPSLASKALLGDVLLSALYPVAVLEIVSDGSPAQRRQVLSRLRQMDLLHTVLALHPPSRSESMMALPRMIGRCGSQRREIPLGPGPLPSATGCGT